MTTFAIMSSVPVTGIIGMPALGAAIAWTLVIMLLAASASILPAILGSAFRDRGRSLSSPPRRSPRVDRLHIAVDAVPRGTA